MALSRSFSPILASNAINKPGVISHNCTTVRKTSWITDAKTHTSKNVALEALRVQASQNKSETKINSILCGDCEGNGCKKCTQCEGTGVNIVDHFNGQFKAGAMCWLCSGKKEILCGNCNGAGFLGGFMSTADS